MAVSIEDIKKLRAMTGAGLADVKNAMKLKVILIKQRKSCVSVD